MEKRTEKCSFTFTCFNHLIGAPPLTTLVIVENVSRTFAKSITRRHNRNTRSAIPENRTEK